MVERDGDEEVVVRKVVDEDAQEEEPGGNIPQ
jgi:hypothetical protein